MNLKMNLKMKTLGTFWLVLSLSLASALALAKGSQAEQLIVWNVGQGQWVTRITSSSCFHFDMGGERAPWKLIEEACQTKRNIASFSHWDWDHVSFVREGARRLKGFCVSKLPAGPVAPKRKTLFDGIALCPLMSGGGSHIEIIAPITKSYSSNSNAFSRVFLLSGSTLIPGDSTSAQERKWAGRIPSPGKVRTLILGHHGSRTSTSSDLLKRLKGLTTAVASTRHEKYGHPHAIVLKRLKNARVPVLITQDWGTLRFEIEARAKR